MVLEGPAGSGKSFIAAQAIAPIARRSRIAFTAPTHEAVGVLRDFAQRCGVTNPTCGTIHSLLHLKMERDADGKERLKEHRRFGKLHVSDFDLVVIDEASMIDMQLWGHICNAPNTFFLVMGDRAQLPAVSNTLTPTSERDLFWREMPALEIPNNRIQLTEIMRYSGPLARFADQVRTSKEIIVPESSGNLIVYRDPEMWIGAMICAFGQHPTGAVKALAYTNSRVSQLAEKIERSEDRECGLGGFLVGDIIKAGTQLLPLSETAAGSLMWRDRGSDLPFLSNSQTAKVIGAQRSFYRVEGFDVTVEGWRLLLQTEAGQNSVFVASKKSYPVIRSLIKDAELKAKKNRAACYWDDLANLKAALGVIQKGSASRPQLIPAVSLNQASTTHKAQGSTTPHVFVDGIDLMSAGNDCVALFYTALTRASATCSILMPAEINQSDSLEFDF